LSVAPTTLPPGHPLAHLRLSEKGIVYDSDIHGLMTVIITERGPISAAATMLRDIIEIVIGFPQLRRNW
jgi:homoserine dehydrogenase